MRGSVGAMNSRHRLKRMTRERKKTLCEIFSSPIRDASTHNKIMQSVGELLGCQKEGYHTGKLAATLGDHTTPSDLYTRNSEQAEAWCIGLHNTIVAHNSTSRQTPHQNRQDKSHNASDAASSSVEFVAIFSVLRKFGKELRKQRFCREECAEYHACLQHTLSVENFGPCTGCIGECSNGDA